MREGEVLAIVGESGSGKSVTSLSVMGLLQAPGRVVAGEILYRGQNLLKLSQDEMRSIRGNQISMIFQEPMTSLNPVFTIENQLTESIRTHMKLDRKAARDRAIEMLRLVGIPSPEKRIKDYPHQMSGGMRQRVMTAMALSCDPQLLIADEPTTALDVTIQAQILALLSDLREKIGMAVLLVTHDLGVVAETADRVVVMYCGRVVEETTAQELFERPLHPYTLGLLRVDSDDGRRRRRRAALHDPRHGPQPAQPARRAARSPTAASAGWTAATARSPTCTRPRAASCAASCSRPPRRWRAP